MPGQDFITCINVYAPNNCTRIHKTKLTEMKEETENSTIIVEDIDTQFSIIDKTRQKTNKELEH
jgi:hypothetical protein